MCNIIASKTSAKKWFVILGRSLAGLCLPRQTNKQNNINHIFYLMIVRASSCILQIFSNDFGFYFLLQGIRRVGDGHIDTTLKIPREKKKRTGRLSLVSLLFVCCPYLVGFPSLNVKLQLFSHIFKTLFFFKKKTRIQS